MRESRLAVCGLAIGIAGAAGAAPQLDENGLSVELVVEELSFPTSLAFLGPDDFLVLEKQNGRVRRVSADVLNPVPVLDLHVNGCGERGLLGIAVHPDFVTQPTPYVYVYYTDSGAAADVDDCNVSTTNEVVRYEWDGDSLQNPLSILSLPSDGSTHNGGVIAFGPDSKLYGVIGDNNRDGQLQNNAAGAAPDDTSMIFRLNDDGTTPTDNPFFGLGGALEKVFAYGVRNSFGLAFDPVSGDLWDTENGPNAFDEINHVVPGANSGWRDIMGPGAAPAGLMSFLGSSYIEPAYSIESPVAVTGLAFVSTDSTFGGDHVGKLLVADFNEGQIYAFPPNAGRDGLDLADTVANNQSELNGFRFASGFDGGITDLDEGPDGNLYVVAIGLGSVYRIVGEAGPAVHDLAVSRLKARKRVTLSESRPLVSATLKATIVNQGSHPETIADLAMLEDLVTLDVLPLTPGCPVAPTAAIVPPKKGFPIELAPRKKLKLLFALDFDCATEELAEFEYRLSVHHAVFGDADADPADDVCPRAPGVGDKGCGGKPAGSPVLTDVVFK